MNIKGARERPRAFSPPFLARRRSLSLFFFVARSTDNARNKEGLLVVRKIKATEVFQDSQIVT